MGEHAGVSPQPAFKNYRCLTMRIMPKYLPDEISDSSGSGHDDYDDLDNLSGY